MWHTHFLIARHLIGSRHQFSWSLRPTNWHIFPRLRIAFANMARNKFYFTYLLTYLHTYLHAYSKNQWSKRKACYWDRWTVQIQAMVPMLPELRLLAFRLGPYHDQVFKKNSVRSTQALSLICHWFDRTKNIRPNDSILTPPPLLTLISSIPLAFLRL